MKNAPLAKGMRVSESRFCRRLRKQKRAARAERTIQQEAANTGKLLNQNTEAMGVLSKALDNEPKGLAQAFAEIKQKGGRK